MSENLMDVGKVAGVVGIAITAMVVIFRDLIGKLILPKPTRLQSFILIILILVLTWSVVIVVVLVPPHISEIDDSTKSQLQSLIDTKPTTIHPTLDLSLPIKGQLQLFPTDKVKIYGSEQSLHEVWFGSGWLPFAYGREYIVQGKPNNPVIPEFKGSGQVKLEVTITKYKDKPRD